MRISTKTKKDLKRNNNIIEFMKKYSKTIGLVMSWALIVIGVWVLKISLSSINTERTSAIIMFIFSMIFIISGIKALGKYN